SQARRPGAGAVSGRRGACLAVRTPPAALLPKSGPGPDSVDLSSVLHRDHVWIPVCHLPLVQEQPPPAAPAVGLLEGRGGAGHFFWSATAWPNSPASACAAARVSMNAGAFHPVSSQAWVACATACLPSRTRSGPVASSHARSLWTMAKFGSPVGASWMACWKLA